MSRARKPCNHAGCPELADLGSYCSRHRPVTPGRPMPKNWSKIRARILQRDARRCFYCGDRATSVDHVIPASRGGSDRDDNLVACCWPCNQRKGARIL